LGFQEFNLKITEIFIFTMSGNVSGDEPTKIEHFIASNVKKLQAGTNLPPFFKKMVKGSCRTTRDEFYLLSFEDKGIHSVKNTPCEWCAMPYYYHRPTIPCDLSIQNATENNAKKDNFNYPTRCSSCGVLLSLHHEDEVVDSDTDDLIEEEAPPSSSTSSSSSSASSSSSSSPSFSSSSFLSSVTLCRLSYDEATRFCTQQSDLLRPCTLCGLPNIDHPRKTAIATISTYRLPSLDQFPKFRDPKDKQMLDPSLFFNRLERAFELYTVPDRLKQRVLIACVKDELMQKWVEDNIVAPKLDWSTTKDVFTVKYTDAQLINDLVEELDSLTQNIGERVHSYGEKYTELLTRLRYPLTSPSHVFACERGFVPEIRKEMARVKAQKSLANDNKPFEFDSITSLLNAAQQIEKGLNPAHSRRSRTTTTTTAKPTSHTTSSTFKRRHRDTSVSNVESVTKTPRLASESTSDSKRGRDSNPGRQGGRNTASQHDNSSSSVTNITANRGRSFRGAYRGRGSFRGRGRGGQNSGGSSSNSGSTTVIKQENRSSRPPLSSPKQFSGKCFVCSEPGHRAVECPTRAHVNMVGQSSVDRSIPIPIHSKQLRHSMFITSPLLPGCHHVMNDSGAQMSLISLRLARKNHLFIHKPSPNDITYITLADRSQHVARIGYVNIPVTINFHGGRPRAPFKCQKSFEVLNISYDFILGVDILPQLFPTDEIMDFLLLPSIISSPAVIVTEEDEQDRFGMRVLTFGTGKPISYTHPDSVVEDYLFDRSSSINTARMISMFDDNLADLSAITGIGNISHIDALHSSVAVVTASSSSSSSSSPSPSSSSASPLLITIDNINSEFASTSRIINCATPAQ
jgi:hypothetical protein